MTGGQNFGQWGPHQQPVFPGAAGYRPPATPRRRFLGLSLVAAGIGLALWAVALTSSEFAEFYVLRRWLHHPALFGAAGSLALAAACALGFRRLPLRIGGAVLLTVVAVGWAALGWLAAGLNAPTHEVTRTPSPDGALELVVTQVDEFDAILRFHVRTHAGLLSRERNLGCLHTEVGRLHDVSWTGPRTIRIVESSAGSTHAVDITVSDAGVPDRKINVSCAPTH